LAKIPTIDKKGKEKFDTRTPKSIVPKVVEYFNSMPLIIAGFDAYQAGDPSLAYDMFIAHCNIPESDMMKDNPSEMAKIVCDSNYYIYLYQSGQLAEAAERYDEALASFERMNTEHAKQNALYDDIVNANVGIYRVTMQHKKDTAKALAFLEECVNAYPKEQVFIQSLIDVYARAGQADKALEYLDLAIQREPEVGLYHLIKGDIYIVFLKQYDNAFASYDKVLAIEPNNPVGYYNYGVAYCEYADKIYNDAAYLSAKEFEVEKAKSQELNKKALPLLEKAYELAPDNGDYKRSLRSLYYRLGMNDKYEALAD
jgi:pentatricopeptide repeat protein